MTMKHFSIILFTALMALVAVDASAQQVVKKRVGIYKEGSSVVVAEATTTLIVDLVVEEEVFISGPYARYAQKLLGSRASLVDYTAFDILSADVAVAGDDSYKAVESIIDEPAEPHKQHRLSDAVFGDILPDRLHLGAVKSDEAAEEAAEQIFALRRARLDLITGEMGDGVFGAGLESALREIDALEQSYMELFFGKRSKTIKTHRIVLPVEDDKTNYLFARFSFDSGLLSSDNLAGEILMLVIEPSNMSYPTGVEKGTITYRYANNATVTVALAQDVLCRKVLPIYEFGKIVYFK